MFANSFQSGFISVFYSVGSNPLSLWDKQVKNGHIRRVIDDEVKSLVLEVSGTNVATTYITCPIKPRASLGIKLPFLVMIIKNMKKYFTFEIQILDDKDMHRRFRVSNFQSTTKVRPFCTTMPIGLSSGWNQVQFNLADFTKRAYGSTYLETTRVQIHANVRIRRIYFADQLYSDEDLPNEFKLFIPVPGERRQSTKPAERSSIDSKGRGSKQLSDIKLKRKSAEEAVPSGAPPSPAEPPGGGEEPVTPAESPIPETPTEEGATTTASSTAAGGGSMDAQHGGDEGGDAPTTTEEEGGETPTAGEGAAPADGEGELVEGEAASEPPAGGEDAAEAPAGDEAAPGGGEETPAAEEGAPSEPPSEPPAEGAEETPTVEEGGGEAPAEEGAAEVTEAPPPAAEEAGSAPEALEGDASEPAEGEAPPE